MMAKEQDFFLQIEGIHKEYPVPHINPFKKSEKLQALSDVHLKIPRGSVSSILGPNGAGKTTLIKILAGLIIQDSGELIWNETSAHKVGLVTPNERSFYWRLTGRQNIPYPI
jgi:ABC-2 type transport system ATP-binding protein